MALKNGRCSLILAALSMMSLAKQVIVFSQSVSTPRYRSWKVIWTLKRQIINDSSRWTLLRSFLRLSYLNLTSTAVACEPRTHFRSSLLSLRREAKTENASAVRRLPPQWSRHRFTPPSFLLGVGRGDDDGLLCFYIQFHFPFLTGVSTSISVV